MRTICIYFVFAFSLLLMSCNKGEHETYASDEILFRVNTPEVTLTKSEITEDNIRDSQVMIYESLVLDGLLYDGSLLKPEMSDGSYTGVWKPETATTWTNYTAENLSFYAYAYSPVAAIGNGLTVNGKGSEIIVSQPDSYNPESNIDYLMSAPVRVPTDISKGKVIPLNLEHAMSKVELYVYCADAMVSTGAQTIEIDILELYIERIHTDVTMVYAPQNVSDKWSRKDYGEADVTYHCPAEFEVKARNDENLSENLALGFIAVPVDNPDMKSRLYIRYTVNVNGAGAVEFSSYFNLADYTSSGWKSNHKIKYELKIDTGISLTGTVTDWVAVDFIEGVVLPEITE